MKTKFIKSKNIIHRCDAKKAKIILGVKFGALPKEAPGLIDLAVNLGLELVGISFHVGSGCEEPEVFERCISIGRELSIYQPIGTELS